MVASEAAEHSDENSETLAQQRFGQYAQNYVTSAPHAQVRIWTGCWSWQSRNQHGWCWMWRQVGDIRRSSSRRTWRT